MENEDILYGYTGKKTDCKTRALISLFRELFLKIYDKIKNIWSYKIFLKTCYVIYVAPLLPK